MNRNELNQMIDRQRELLARARKSKAPRAFIADVRNLLNELEEQLAELAE